MVALGRTCLDRLRNVPTDRSGRIIQRGHHARRTARYYPCDEAGRRPLQRKHHVPDDRKATIWLADALFRLHKTDEAREVLQSFLADLDALDEDKKNVAEIILSKQRNGPTGSIKLAFLKQFTRFDNYFGE